ncbi:hypothetical protein [Candidatus Sororendozoicomonas aggregata]|uniref:hypothetical protein n=1 Tax=Candidatus Sororendozoicomonas aggregata TaxID=3073239 RepID=UPI002ED2B935
MARRLVLLSANTHTVVIPAKAGIYQRMDSHLRRSDQSDGCMYSNACLRQPAFVTTE